MVEIASIDVDPIVAGQAVAAEIHGVGLHESCINLDVTGGADGLVERWDIVLRVTILAIEGGTVGFALVGGQCISHRIVREVSGIHGCQRSIWTAMVGVAVDTGQVGKYAVQWGRGQLLACHVCVTDHTPVSHGLGAPEGGVTQIAPAGDVCMGAHAA